MSDALPPIETATGMTRSQATKLVKMTEQALLQSVVFSGMPTTQIDAFIKSVGPDIRKAIVELAERRFQTYISYYRIQANFAAENAIQAVIDANAFDYEYIHIEASNIPLGGIGEVVEQVHEIHFGKVMYNRDLPEALKKKGQEDGFENGYVFANPLTALIIALKNPDVQKDHPLSILFYVGEQLYCLFLSSVNGDKRVLDVRKSYSGRYWNDNVRFLVVSAPVPAV